MLTNCYLFLFPFLCTVNNDDDLNPMNDYEQLKLIEKPENLNDPKMTKEDDEWISELVNLVMVSSDYRIKDDYRSTLESSFDGLVVNRDFKSGGNNLVNQVNQLVANKTNNLIKKALDGPIDTNTKLIVLNVFSFEGNWLHPFPKSLIIRRPFYGVDNISSLSTTTKPTTSSTSSSSSTLKAYLSAQTTTTTSASLMGSRVINMTSDRVPFMTTSLRTNYAEINEKDMKIIQLDYVGNASMFILLPNQRDSLLHLVRNLTVQEIDSYIGGRLTQSDIDIEIPKFTFEVQYDLMERLEDLRLSIRRADYTGIAERIEEEGTKVEDNDGNESIGSGGHGGVVGRSDAEGGASDSSKSNKDKKSKNDSKDKSNKSDIVDSLKRRGDGSGGEGRSRSSSNNIRISNGSSGRSRSSNSSNKKELSRAQVRDQGHLSLTSAIHKSIIKVDEKGTKAAAFTGFGFHPLSTVSGQAQFIADHPFLFFIRDKSKGVNIFTGAVNKLTG